MSDKSGTSFQDSSSLNASHSMESNYNQEKNIIKSHPLFPLLALAFEKCDLATCTARFNGADICTSQSFTDDIQAFAAKVKDSSSIFTSNHNIDSLMIQAIQVLRIHLLELEKVHNLCNNFCKRYISSLEGKMPLDLVIEGDNGDIKNISDEINSSGKPQEIRSNSQSLNESPLPNSNSSSLGTFSNTLHNRESGTQSPYQSSCAFIRRTDHEGCSPASSETNPDSTESFVEQEDDDIGRPKQKKRGIFPKIATNIMKAWLFQHLAHPYPSEDQKRILANDTGLTILQVNNWFINARRRIVQPMIDASSRSGKTPVVTVFKSRKRKVTSSHHLQSNSNIPSYYQQPCIYNQEQYYPSFHSMHYANANVNGNHFFANANTSCEYESGFPIQTSASISSLSSCMQTRQQAFQSQHDDHMAYNHHSNVSQFLSCPVYSSDTQIQNDQFYIKAT